MVLGLNIGRENPYGWNIVAFRNEEMQVTPSQYISPEFVSGIHRNEYWPGLSLLTWIVFRGVPPMPS